MNSEIQLSKRTNVLGVGVSSLDMDSAVETLLSARQQGLSGYVCVTGVHGVIESQRDPELKMIHNRSFLTVPDGMPTVWVGREQGFSHMGRVYGPDLMLAMMAATAKPQSAESRAPGDSMPHALGADKQADSMRHAPCAKPPYGKCYSHFLYGATEEMLAQLKANLEARFPGVRIVGTYAPPFRPLTDEEEEELRQVVVGCKPDFFWVGLSTPKQERFMAAHAPAAQGGPVDSCSVIVDKGNPQTTGNRQPSTDAALRHHLPDCGIMLGVGAAFPIHAGLQKDAPEWIKNSGLQWFYRLCQEPRRLWRRYLDIVPTFLWLTALQLLGIRKYRVED